MSVLLKQSQIRQQVDISVMKMSMEAAAAQGDLLAALLGETAQTMETAVLPHLGASVDIRI